LHFVDRSFSGFISGKIIDSAIIGLLCFAFSMIAGLPYGILVSVIVGITNVIPFFGPYLGAVPSALLILTGSPWKCLIFVVFIIILQQIDGNVIGPMILGDKVGLSSFWILFAILVFGALWGLVGMIVGVPIFAVAYDLITRSVSYGLKKKERTDLLEDYKKAYPPEEKKDKKK
ncbi:MAG: AI-2E family transporter, partial [bacterium]